MSGEKMGGEGTRRKNRDEEGKGNGTMKQRKEKEKTKQNKKKNKTPNKTKQNNKNKTKKKTPLTRPLLCFRIASLAVRHLFFSSGCDVVFVFVCCRCHLHKTSPQTTGHNRDFIKDPII